MEATTPRKGRPPKQVDIVSVSPLEEEDLQAMVKQGPAHGARISEMRASHHKVAQLMATGAKAVEIHAATGYSTITQYQLKESPAFKELLAHYVQRGEREALNLRGRFELIALDALELLEKELKKEELEIDPGTILKILETAADRCGFGKQSSVDVRNSHLHLTAADLAAMKERQHARERGAVVHTSFASEAPEAQPAEVAIEPSEDRSVSVGGPAQGETAPQAAEVIRLKS